MTAIEMEEKPENLDRWLGVAELILPTLATKAGGLEPIA